MVKGKSNSEESLEKEVDEAPLTGTDGKWGWFVVFNSFICNMIVDGMQYTFANFLEPIAVTFNSTLTQVSLIGSLLSGFYNFSGPIAGALGNKFGFRMVVIAGSIISAGGLMVSYFAPNTQYLYAFYGILGGLGFGMIYMASVITTSVYFEKYRALAASLSVCGTGAGTFVFSPMGTWLVSTVGWRYALVAEGGVILLCLFCGLSFKPLAIITVVPINQEASAISSVGSSTSITNQAVSQPQGSMYYPTEIKKTAPNEAYPTFREALLLQEIAQEERRGSVATTRRVSYQSERMSVRQGQRQIYSIMSSVARTDHEREPKGKKQKFKKCCNTCCFNFWHCRCKKKNLTLGDRPLYRDDIFYGGSLSTLPVYSPREGLNYHLSVTRVPDAQELEQHVSQKCCVCHHAFLRTCATMTGIGLLRSKVFTFLCVSSFFYTMSLFIPYVFIRKVAHENGIEDDLSVWLVSAIGICNTAGRLVSGIVKSFLPVNASLLVLVCLLISGLISGILFFFANLPALIVYSCVYGFFTAPFISLRPVIIVDFLGLEKLTNAFGLVLLSQGVASVIGPPLAGYLEEITGDSLYVLYLSGSLLLVSSCALFLAIILHRQLNKQRGPDISTEDVNRSQGRLGTVSTELIKDEELFAIVPPNGGWGWLVVLCAFYCNVVVDGIQLTFGIFLKSISKDLHAEYSQIAMAASVMFGLHLVMGPVCCGFNSAFGLRPVTITGSLLCSFGVGISYFSPNYWSLSMTFGVIGGIGLGMVYMNTLVITSLYFTTMLPVAIAVVVSGTGVGTMVFAGLGSVLLHTTTWQNSFLIQSALAGSMAIAAIAFKPLKPIRVKLSVESDASVKFEEETEKEVEKNKGVFIKTELPRGDSFHSLVTIQTVARSFVENVISGDIDRNTRTNVRPNVCAKCCRWFKRSGDPEYLVLSELRSPPDTTTRRRSYVEKVGKGRKGRWSLRKTWFLSLPETNPRSDGDVEANESPLAVNRIHSSVSYNTIYTRIDIAPAKAKTRVWNKLKKPIIRMLDCHLLKSYNFFLFAFIGATELASFLIVLIYEKDRSEDLGLSEDMGVYFIVAIGAANVFWRLFLGGIALIQGINYAALAACGVVIGGLGTTFSGFNDHILYQFAFCFIFSLGMASYAVFRMPFLVDLVGAEKIENATGINLLFMGILCIIFPPLFGWLLELTQSYKIMFIVTGIIIVLSGLAQLAVRRKKHAKR